ncbi:hypothetical protein CI109_100980 [Kwoniella shandongensis]|uniref:Uncharacterized protein n=1 Tax=Kwoniella shandongensis TaxID=1734106 RepID=A0A5M6C9G8_9TREE|nr:uncharacterized protein CI109_001448 [Kwoniella shandongensis]KAA5530045.1 hypothetical protein CI109_001448 [Kwoniella shandongensis]
MHLPTQRPWLISPLDPTFCPPYLSTPIHTLHNFLWTHRLFAFLQKCAPYELASEVLENLVDSIEEEDRKRDEEGEKRREGLRVVDFGSGSSSSGGRESGRTVLAVERKINQHRQSSSKQPIRFLLTHPDLPSSSSSSSSHSLPTSSSSSTISYLPESVDARQATINNKAIRDHRHIRTFFSTFHQFGEESARRVIVDAFGSAEAMCIFELQQSDLASLIMVFLLAPLSWLLTPFQRPTWTTLFFTYIIPLIPLLLVLDGIMKVYRSRSIPHFLHLANLASLNFHLEGGKPEEDIDWKWEYGKKRHTWSLGTMVWVVGRRDRRNDRRGGGEGSESDSDSDSDLGMEAGVEELL